MRYAALLIPLILAACGTVPVTLAYTPSHTLGDPVARPVIALAAPQGPQAARLGAARGDFDVPVQLLTLPKGAGAQVDAVFAQALTARGLLAPLGAARYDLLVAVPRLRAGSALTRGASVHLVVTLTRRADGVVVYRNEVAAAEGGLPIVSPTIVSLDSLAYAPVVMDEVTADRVLGVAVDRVLDDPAFRAAIAT